MNVIYFLMIFCINWIVFYNEVVRFNMFKEFINILKNGFFSKKNFSYMFDKNNIYLYIWLKIKMLFYEKMFSLLSLIWL